VIDDKRLNKVYISQAVIEKITKFIANQKPESGGILMGPPDKDAITFFEYDRWGSMSEVTYTPNAIELSEIANKVNHEKGWIIKGIVHSHPQSMSSLSEGDRQTIGKYFQHNPELPYFIAPVVYTARTSQHYAINSIDLKGNSCNALVAHVMYPDEINDIQALSRSVFIEIFNNLREVPNSRLPFISSTYHNLTDRDRRDIKDMKRRASNAKPHYVEDGVVWYEQLNRKGRKYKLCYWFDLNDNSYKAAVIEGLEYNDSLIHYISAEGIINIAKNGSDICPDVLNARKRAINALDKVIHIPIIVNNQSSNKKRTTYNRSLFARKGLFSWFSFLLHKIKKLKVFNLNNRIPYSQNLLSAALLNEVIRIKDFHEYSEKKSKAIEFSIIIFTIPEIDILVECKIPSQFPFFSPRVMVIRQKDNFSFELPINWNFLSEELPEHQLGRLLKDALFSEGFILQTASDRSTINYGPIGMRVAATSDPEIANQQGWQPIYSQKLIPLDIADKYFARSGGLLSQKLTDKCVAIFGCGSGGSYLAEQLVRSGLGNLILCDMDNVEAENLCRSGYEIADLGVSKVKALARKLRNVNPAVRLQIYDKDLRSLSHKDLIKIIESSQVVIAGTDMPDAQKRLNKYAYQLGIPAVFPGLYDQASGGEIVMTIPEKTPCYQCSLGHKRTLIEAYSNDVEVDNTRESSTRIEAEIDYGTGTLKAEPSLSADIQHLDSITVKLVLGLLLQDIPDEVPCETRNFIRGLFPQSEEDKFATKNFVITSHSPNFWFFSELRSKDESRVHDYAYHTVWAETSEYRKSECTICGDNPESLSPSISVEQVFRENAARHSNLSK
jgi:molybdopterin/thiamine biosynthesis adenylyltransferase/proteasome lid subunit RPN8/RPN11